MAADTVAPKRTLKIKFSTQSRDLSAENRPSDKQTSAVSTLSSCSSVDENSHPKTEKSNVSSDGNKRKFDSEEFQSDKRTKMDRPMTQQCSSIVKSLIRHPAGWVFKEPVDPVKLGIPDYFSIIKNPMDLGTIKSKLDKNQYHGVEEFVADVRLTFSNAMFYNPPSNSVHQMAKELNTEFDTRWRSLGEVLRSGQSRSVRVKLHTVVAEQTNEQEQRSPKTPVHTSVALQRKPKASKGKVEKRVKASKNPLLGLSIVKENNCNKPPVHDVSHCATCGNCDCQCNQPCDPAPAISDVSYERTFVRESCASDTSEMNCVVKDENPSKITKSDQDSDGAVSALDEEIVCPNSEFASTTDATSAEGWRSPSFDVQLSPAKALRAAMLKQRFADTILKAKHKTLHEHADPADPAKMRAEKERLEKRQREERARIEAQIRAAEAASRMKEEMELKRQRQCQREAARLALQQIEKTADIELNLEILKELEILSGGCLVYSPRGKVLDGAFDVLDSPLERLGLFIKDEADDLDDEVVNAADGEEGEILF